MTGDRSGRRSSSEVGRTDGSVSIPAPYDSVQARVDGEAAYDSRHGGSLDAWAKSILAGEAA